MSSIVKFLRGGWRDMKHSFIAGTFFSMPLSWLACTLLPLLPGGFERLGIPWVNATMGVVVSIAVYTSMFAWLSGRRLTEILLPLLSKEALEMLLRWLIHFSLMQFFGVPAAIASITGQVLAGLSGHVATPAFVRRREHRP